MAPSVAQRDSGFMSHYDVVIVGGGMVGLSLANALLPMAKHFGLNVAMVEASPAPKASDTTQAHPSFDVRTTALSAGTRNLYQAMDVWSFIERQACPVHTIHVSGKGHFGATRLSHTEEGVEALGYVVENHWLGRALSTSLDKNNQGQITWYQPAQVESIGDPTASDDDQPLRHITLQQNGETLDITAELVVLADGGRSPLKAQLGISDNLSAYGQHAVVAVIEPSKDHHNLAYERFAEEGPVALLPLLNHRGHRRYGLVWTVADDEVDEVLALSDEAFLTRLQATFGYRAGHFTRVGERSSYPLAKKLAAEQVRPGVVVLGNAAHSLHPVAGQGFNLALRGATSLVEQLINMKQQGLSLADAASLSAYAEARSFDQLRTIESSEKMMQLFCSPHPLLRAIRGASLQLMDVCKPAKTLLARAAMGVDIAAPNLNPLR